MKKKLFKYIQVMMACLLIASLTLPSYAAVSASDGSAFVTKAEFDAALSDFNARLTTFEAGINSKIDSQVSSYLDRNGIWNGKTQTTNFPLGVDAIGSLTNNIWVCDLLSKYTQETKDWYPQVAVLHTDRNNSKWNSTNYSSDTTKYHGLYVVGGDSTGASQRGAADPSRPYLWVTQKVSYNTTLVNDVSKSGLMMVDLTYGWFYNFSSKDDKYFGLYDWEKSPNVPIDINNVDLDTGVSAGGGDYSGMRISKFVANNKYDHWDYPTYSLKYSFSDVQKGKTMEIIKQQGDLYTWTAPFTDVFTPLGPHQAEHAGFMIPSMNPTRCVYYFFVQRNDKIQYNVWDEFGARWKNWGWSIYKDNKGVRKFVAQINDCLVY